MNVNTIIIIVILSAVSCVNKPDNSATHVIENEGSSPVQAGLYNEKTDINGI